MATFSLSPITTGYTSLLISTVSFTEYVAPSHTKRVTAGPQTGAMRRGTAGHARVKSPREDTVPLSYFLPSGFNALTSNTSSNRTPGEDIHKPFPFCRPLTSCLTPPIPTLMA